MDYANLFTRAWTIVWRNKFMFLLGFLATLGSGGSGGNFSFGGDEITIPPGVADQLERFWAQFSLIVIVFGCLLFFAGLILWLVRLTAQAGMIDAAVRLDAGEKVRFGHAFSAGLRKLARLVGINILLYGPFALLGVIAFALFIATAGAAVFNAFAGAERDINAIVGTLGILAACFAGLACLSAPLLLLITIIYPFAQRGAVLQDLSVTSSIGHGWQIVKNNLVDIFLLIVIFLIIGFVIGLVTAAVVVPLVVLSMGPAFLAMIRGATPGMTDFIFMIGGLVLVAIIGAAINAVLVAFRSTVVTLAYQEFLTKAKSSGLAG